MTDDDLFSLVPDETMAKFCEKLGTSPELLRATVRELRKKNSNVKTIRKKRAVCIPAAHLSKRRRD